MMLGNDYFFKLIMLGTSGAGKTCIVQRYCNDIYEGATQKSTMGFDFLTKTIQKNGKEVSLEIWDTAGQEKYKAVTKMYYKDVHGAVLVYDTTDKQSLEKLAFWLDDLDTSGNKLERRILVGSKIDMRDERQVSLYDAKRFACERNLDWMECSAKTSKNVNEVFDCVLGKIIEAYNTSEEFKRICRRSTIISVAPPISEEDSAHRREGYRLNRKALKQKQGNACC